ncbi:MAG: glycoside hydrolase family 2 [Clostridiales bacterium]|nr:glycoside hydrolase family 2 [Clostridiales bacterium]
MKKQRFNRLYTEAGERLKNDPRAIPWDEYPRPHLRRKEWLNLNGLWEFETESGYRGNIRVPFPAESPLSGFEGELRYGEKLTYKRSFTVPEGWRGKRILLHYTASRQSEAFVNGARFRGGDSAYFAVCRDITKAISEGQNELKIICSNDLDPAYPYGKQRIKRGGMWYTPCSGMWQTVWLEPVPEDFIADIRCFQDGNEQTIFVSPSMNGELVCEGKTYPLVNGECLLRFDPPRLWSPEEPNLYEFRIVAGEDEAESYFAFRTIETKTINGVPRLCLNGKPYFFNGLLDQGYFSDGLWTPAEPAEYERDIMRMKSLGFNMLRKHIKIEPELFYYYCDRLGMAVFQDMVNNGRCSFFRDTLLPTAGITRLDDRRLNRSEAARERFLGSLRETVGLLGSHPSIVYWTIFNEGWGQFCADEAYEMLKKLDPSRPIDTTSGWFHQKKTDVFSLHVYFKKLRPFKKGGLPQAVSEFGGYVWKDAAHSFNPEKTYGYRILRSREEFVKAIRSLYLDELLPLVKGGLSAAVYTQVSDVEDETNGLLTYDRRVMKLSPEEFLDAAGEIKKAAQAE